jgi:hypothetical protein
MSDDEQLIHIGAVGRVLYTARWLVASLFVVFLAAYALAVWLGASYSARAVIRTPDLTVAEFKRVLETAADQAAPTFGKRRSPRPRAASRSSPCRPTSIRATDAPRGSWRCCSRNNLPTAR